MKHTRNITLVLLGTVSALALAGCMEEDAPREGQAIYETIQQCRDAEETDCEARFTNAVANHVATGPRYSSEQACMERGHERCMNVNTGESNIWLPAMVGFMLGQTMATTRPVWLQQYPDPTTDREREDRRVVAGGTRGGNSPVFVGSWAHAGGSSFAPGTLSSGMSSGAARSGISTVSAGGRAMASPSAAARGGFGAAGAGAGAS